MITKKCKNCGNNFESERWRHYIFCGQKCYHEYRKKYPIKRNTVKIICKQCKKEFENYKSNHRKFCCKKCSDKYQKGKPGNRKRNGIYKKCLNCGKEFYLPKWRMKRNISPKYCSRKCADKKRNGMMITSEVRNCKICGKEFKVMQSMLKNGRGKYCSMKCYHLDQERVKFLKGHIPWNKGLKGYQALEKHPNWLGGKSFEPYGIEFNNRLKEKIRKRDNYTCQECGYTQEQLRYKLCVHHIDYNKQNNNLDNLITLCRSCHTKTNFRRKDWIDYFKNKVRKE